MQAIFKCSGHIRDLHSMSYATKVYQVPFLSRSVACRGINFPLAGLGSLDSKPDTLSQAVTKGFHLIDTAKAYGNEEQVGIALRSNGLLNNVIVMTKLFNSNFASIDHLHAAIEDSKSKIGKMPEHILIHGPYPGVNMMKMLQELEIMKSAGSIKEWGVSNFDLEHLKFIVSQGFTPTINQVEYHPYFQRKPLLDYCQQMGIILQAYRPLAAGKVLHDDLLKHIAGSHKVSVATVVYSWLAQQNIPMVTSVSKEEHQNEYANSEMITLDDEQMQAIATLHSDEGRTCTKGGWLVPFTEGVASKWNMNHSLVELSNLKSYGAV